MPDDEYREISDEELDRILAYHWQWLESEGADGKQADLSRCGLEGNRLVDAWARVFLKKAPTKGGLTLKKAKLVGAHLEGAHLWFADLGGANLSSARLQNSELLDAHLEGAILRFTDLREADLRGVNFEGAYFRKANVEGANFTHASLLNANIRSIKYNRKTRCRGVNVEGCYGSPMFKRFAQDQDFLEELQERSWWGKPLYYTWLVLADCGRTPWRWILWSVLFAIWFAMNFYWLGPDAFRLTGDVSDPGNQPLPYTLGTTIYYSVVTFTTLGFGDITPKTATAAWWVMAEVIVGYIMLGGLISIMATLVARRSS